MLHQSRDFSATVIHSGSFNRIKSPFLRVGVISAKNHKVQSVTAKREKSQTPKVLTAILNLPNLTWPNLTYTNFGVRDFARLAVTDRRLRR